MASADPRDPQYGKVFTPTADVQTITITGSPTGGTYTLSFGGQTTSALAFNANAAAIQAALQALSTIGSGKVAVTGTGPFLATFSLYGLQGAITATGSLTGGTSPAVAVVHTTKGTPTLGSTSRAGAKTVLNMHALKSQRITASDSDAHYTANGAMYHE